MRLKNLILFKPVGYIVNKQNVDKCIASFDKFKISEFFSKLMNLLLSLSKITIHIQEFLI